ncbi:MAG: Spy/CpxP family protein refolding chaperone [Bacteroidota bacterium]
MRKNTIILIALVFLIIMNGILLYLVVQKPERPRRQPREFLAKELALNPQQLEQYEILEKDHHRQMRALDDRFKRLKGDLFRKLGEPSDEKMVDSLTRLIGQLSQERELELFHHFSDIERICTPEQKEKLKQLVAGALHPKGPPHGPSPHDRPPR